MAVQIQRFELTAEDKSAAAFDSMKRRVLEMIGTVGSLGGAFQLLAGGFSVGVFSKLIGDSITAMDELHKMSIITGQSVESLSAMRSIAKESGVEFEGVANGAAKLAKNMLDTARGTGKAGATFDELGLSVLDSSGQLKTSDTMMLEVAKSLAGMSNETQRTAYAQALFGKAGAALLPFLMLLAERGLDNAKVTKQQADEAHNFEVAIAKLQSASRAWFMHLASELLPTLTKMLDLVKPMAVVLGAAFAVFVVAPALIAPTVAAFGALSASVSLAAGAFAAGKMAEGFAAMNLMLSGTFFWTTATASAIGALTVASSVLFAGWGGWVIGDWLQRNFVEARIAGIVFIDSMLKGWEYLKYGGQLAWLGVKTAFMEVIGSIQNKLAAFFELFASGLSMLPGMSKPAAFINEVAASLRSAAIGTTDFSTEQAALKGELDKNLAGISAITSEMVYYELFQDKAAAAVKNHTDKVKINTKAEDEYQKLLANANKYLDQMEKETRQLGMDAAAKRADEVATLALDLRERDRIAFLTRASTDLQAYIDKEDALRRIKTDREMLDADAQALDAAIKANDEYGKSASQITQLTIAKKEAQLATLNFVGATATETSALEASIVILRKVAAEQSKLADRTAIDEAQRQIEAEAKKTVETIDKDVHQGFTRMFDKLGGGWEGFLKSMVQSFKKLVADQIYMFFARPIVLQLIAGTAGSLGLTSIANAAMTSAGLANAATTGSGGSGLNLLSSASNFLGMGQAPAWYNAADAAAGTGAYTFGTGAAGAVAASNAAEAAAGGSIMAGGEAAATGVLAAIPVYGWAALAAAAVGAYLLSGNDRGPASAQWAGLNGRITAGGYTGSVDTAWGSSMTDLWGGSTSASLPQDQLTAFNKAISIVFAQMTTAAQTLGLQTTDLQNLVVSAGTTTQGVQADMALALQNTADAIALKLIPNIKDLQQNGETLAQTFLRLAAAQAALDAQRRTMDIALMEAQGNAVEALAAKREDELKALDATLRPLQNMIYAAQDLATAFTAAQTSAKDATDAQIQASQKTADSYRSAAQSFHQLAQSITDTMHQLSGGALSPLTSGQKYAAAGTSLDAIYEQVVYGNQQIRESALAQLPQAATDFLNASRAQNASGQQFTSDYDKAQAMLAKAEQIGGMVGNNQDLLAATFDKNTATLQDLATAIQDAVKNDASVTLLNDISTKLGEGSNDAAGLLGQLLDQNYAARLDAEVRSLLPSSGTLVSNGTLAVFDQQMAIWRETNPAPSHATGGLASGWSMVGEIGREMVDFQTPGRVYTADQTRGMFAPAANDDLLTEMKALRAEVARLTAQVAAGDTANVQATEGVAQAHREIAHEQRVRQVPYR
jgi:hypothetical protein